MRPRWLLIVVQVQKSLGGMRMAAVASVYDTRAKMARHEVGAPEWGWRITMMSAFIAWMVSAVLYRGLGPSRRCSRRPIR